MSNTYKLFDTNNNILVKNNMNIINSVQNKK
jgi:hypothetical protein